MSLSTPKLYGRTTLWKEHPDYGGRYDFAVRKRPPGEIDTITTDYVTALVYPRHIFNVPIPFSKPTYYFTHFHWNEPDGKHTISREDVVLFFEATLDFWETHYHTTVDLEEGRHYQQVYHQPPTCKPAVGIEYRAGTWLAQVHSISLTLGALANMENSGDLPDAWRPYDGPIRFHFPTYNDSPLLDGKVSDFAFRMAEAYPAHGYVLGSLDEGDFQDVERELQALRLTLPEEVGWRRWPEVREPGQRHIQRVGYPVETVMKLVQTLDEKWAEV